MGNTIDEEIEEVIYLFIDAGVDQSAIDHSYRRALQLFFKDEEQSLETWAIVNVIKHFSYEERLELFEKIRRKY